jgi:hypothetical protein
MESADKLLPSGDIARFRAAAQEIFNRDGGVDAHECSGKILQEFQAGIREILLEGPSGSARLHPRY